MGVNGHGPKAHRCVYSLRRVRGVRYDHDVNCPLRAAFRNGVTREEIREVLLQTAIYCGVPAANSAFKQAREVFAQMEREGAS